MKQMEPMKPMEPIKPQQAWWPGDLGQPDSAGGQHNHRYAFFGARRRLAVQADGQVKLYDTGSHRINGFGQQQGSGNPLSFNTNEGPVDVESLRVVG